jgi:hypothetical protein
VDDAHYGWDRVLLVENIFQHWKIFFQVTTIHHCKVRVVVVAKSILPPFLLWALAYFC